MKQVAMKYQNFHFSSQLCLQNHKIFAFSKRAKRDSLTNSTISERILEFLKTLRDFSLSILHNLLFFSPLSNFFSHFFESRQKWRKKNSEFLLRGWNMNEIIVEPNKYKHTSCCVYDKNEKFPFIFVCLLYISMYLLEWLRDEN